MSFEIIFHFCYVFNDPLSNEKQSLLKCKLLFFPQSNLPTNIQYIKIKCKRQINYNIENPKISETSLAKCVFLTFCEYPIMLINDV